VLVALCACEPPDSPSLAYSRATLGEADGAPPPADLAHRASDGGASDGDRLAKPEVDAQPAAPPSGEPVHERVAAEHERQGPPRYVSAERLRTFLDRGQSLAVVRVLDVDERVHTYMQDGLSFHAYRGTARLAVERHLAGPALPAELDIGYPLTHYSVEVEVGATYLLPISADRDGFSVPYRHGDLPTRVLRVEDGRLPAADVAVDVAAAREGK
jgi:hypothetical protein